MVKKKKKAKPLNEARSRADHGTPEALRQADGVQFETVDGGRLGSVKRAYISRQTPMDRYKARGLVNQRQYDAAHAFFVLLRQDATGRQSDVKLRQDHRRWRQWWRDQRVCIQRLHCVEPEAGHGLRQCCPGCGGGMRERRWLGQALQIAQSRMGIEKLRDGLDRLAKIMGVS